MNKYDPTKEAEELANNLHLTSKAAIDYLANRLENAYLHGELAAANKAQEMIKDIGEERFYE